MLETGEQAFLRTWFEHMHSIRSSDTRVVCEVEVCRWSDARQQCESLDAEHFYALYAALAHAPPWRARNNRTRTRYEHTYHGCADTRECQAGADKDAPASLSPRWYAALPRVHTLAHNVDLAPHDSAGLSAVLRATQYTYVAAAHSNGGRHRDTTAAAARVLSAASQRHTGNCASNHMRTTSVANGTRKSTHRIEWRTLESSGGDEPDVAPWGVTFERRSTAAATAAAPYKHYTYACLVTCCSSDVGSSVLVHEQVYTRMRAALRGVCLALGHTADARHARLAEARAQYEMMRMADEIALEMEYDA